MHRPDVLERVSAQAAVRRGVGRLCAAAARVADRVDAPLATVSDRFIRAVHRLAQTEGIEWVDFTKGQRKDEVMQERLRHFTATQGVVFIGRAQEKNTVFRTEKRCHQDGVSYPWIVKSTGIIKTTRWGRTCGRSRSGPFRNSKNSATRSGVGCGGNTAGESSPTCRAALNSSTGQTNRTPNNASNSTALRDCRNR